MNWQYPVQTASANLSRIGRAARPWIGLGPCMMEISPRGAIPCPSTQLPNSQSDGVSNPPPCFGKPRALVPFGRRRCSRRRARMLVKEWTIDEKGRAQAIWVKREFASPLECLVGSESAMSASDSIVPLTRPVENEVRLCAPVEAPAAPQRREGNPTSSSFSKTKKWTWVLSVLRGVLP
jgi:hypothetical protein